MWPLWPVSKGSFLSPWSCSWFDLLRTSFHRFPNELKDPILHYLKDSIFTESSSTNSNPPTPSTTLICQTLNNNRMICPLTWKDSLQLSWIHYSVSNCEETCTAFFIWSLDYLHLKLSVRSRSWIWSSKIHVNPHLYRIIMSFKWNYICSMDNSILSMAAWHEVQTFWA